MTEATGCEAKTLHRLLGGSHSGHRKRCRAGEVLREIRKIHCEADVVIIDEMSMVDIYLMHSLLLALVPGTRLIMAGDRDEFLPPGAWKRLEGHYRVQMFSGGTAEPDLPSGNGE